MTLTFDQREALRQKIMAEMTRRMPIVSKRFNDWRDWPGTWAFADVAVAALQDELALGVRDQPANPNYGEGLIGAKEFFEARADALGVRDTSGASTNG